MSRRVVLALAAAVIAVFVLWPEKPDRWLIRNTPAGSGPVVCFGDSLTAGFGVDPEESYPSVLGRLLDRETVNRGRNGDTAASALERLEEDVLRLDPAVVVMTLGGNDILRRVPAEETLVAVRGIFTQLLAADVMVVFLAIDPPFVDGKRMERIRVLARELGVLWVPGVMKGLWGDRSQMVDRIHPNAEGHRVIAGRVRDALADHL